MTKRNTAASNQKSTCSVCKSELAVIQIPVDGDVLLMESCHKCDKRFWQLAGKRIDLEEALTEVREHLVKRR